MHGHLNLKFLRNVGNCNPDDNSVTSQKTILTWPVQEVRAVCL